MLPSFVPISFGPSQKVVCSGVFSYGGQQGEQAGRQAGIRREENGCEERNRMVSFNSAGTSLVLVLDRNREKEVGGGKGVEVSPQKAPGLDPPSIWKRVEAESLVTVARPSRDSPVSSPWQRHGEGEGLSEPGADFTLF